MERLLLEEINSPEDIKGLEIHSLEVLAQEIRDKISLFFKDKKKIARYLPEYEHLTARQIARTSHIEIFRYDIPEGIKTGSYKKADTAVLFDYNLPCKIFERSRWIRIEL